MNVAEFFLLAETTPKARAVAADAPPFIADLLAANDREGAFDVRGARAALAEAQSHAEPLASGFAEVARLLELRADVREATSARLGTAEASIEALIAEANDPATKARALWLLAVARIRLGRLEAAEVALTDALDRIEDAPAKMWMVDTMCQLYIGQGAWTEARRTLRALVQRRKEAGDRIGVAISAGHLARLELHLGAIEASIATSRAALEQLPDDAALLTVLRLQTLLTGAVLEEPSAGTREESRDALAVEVRKLEGLTNRAVDDPHYLKGYAVMTLARAASAMGDADASERWLAVARATFTLPGHMALLRYYEAKIDPRVTETPGWVEEVEKLCAETEFVSEGEVMLRLLLARRAHERGDDVGKRVELERTYVRVRDSNNPLWLHWVDELAGEIDPTQLSDRIATRFSGRSLTALRRTSREDATIIFADLVSFTPRALELEPEEVMDTVRALFELGVPLLARHHVMPLSYLGDGLLAICQGDGHERRGLAFARDLVARAGRVSRLRKLLGAAWGLDLRAGVASGPVVLGTLGTLFKTEFAAIGATTNLAARLQGMAAPGEVMCASTTARAAELNQRAESLTLKGFDRNVEAYRIDVYASQAR
jgi:class 3 adenylate cyclase/tetratricopeptide (TPR) repeat protein